MNDMSHQEVIAHRFRLPTVPTVLTSRPARSPMAISHIRCDDHGHGANRVVPVEDAYAINIALRDLDADIWLHGKRTDHKRAAAGGLYIFNLESEPVVDFRSSFELVRFYLSKVALDELTRDAGLRSHGSLAALDLGTPDVLMHMLARAILPALQTPEEVNQLYVDYMALAFHAHLVGHYAGPCGTRGRTRAGLCAWQARLAAEMIDTKLDGRISVSELAAECRLSQSHFSRAFVRTFGMPPHRWLLNRRVDRAKALIEAGCLSLTDVATSCGFASQSHLNRVFLSVAGTTPSRWRRMKSRADALPHFPTKDESIS